MFILMNACSNCNLVEQWSADFYIKVRSSQCYFLFFIKGEAESNGQKSQASKEGLLASF